MVVTSCGRPCQTAVACLRFLDVCAGVVLEIKVVVVVVAVLLAHILLTVE